MADTSIEWCDVVWNPLAGCTRVSEGCRNCYAEVMAARLVNMGQAEKYGPTVRGGVARPRWTGRVVEDVEALSAPMRWRKPRRVFVNSMSDLFHEGASAAYVAAVFGVMAATPRHTYLILTKRPKRAAAWFQWVAGLPADPFSECHYEALMHDGPDEVVHRLSEDGPRGWPLPNVWLGVSVEDQDAADERIPVLLDIPAAVHWVSAEPLLGPLRLRRWLNRGFAYNVNGAIRVGGGASYFGFHRSPEHDPPRVRWVVVGGESGHGARPMKAKWVRHLRDECRTNAASFFFKQWGQFDADGKRQRSKKAAGRVLDGRTWDEFPEVTHG